MTYLFDLDLLLALAWPSHVHHETAHGWIEGEMPLRWATCPLTRFASWRTRLAWFDRDLDTESARIRGFYEVRARRVEPIGLACLWPDRGVTGMIGSHQQFRVILGVLVPLLATGDR